MPKKEKNHLVWQATVDLILEVDDAKAARLRNMGEPVWDPENPPWPLSIKDEPQCHTTSKN